MKHNLKICIASGPETGGIVRCETVRLRERVLRRLFGDTRRVTIIDPRRQCAGAVGSGGCRRWAAMIVHENVRPALPMPIKATPYRHQIEAFNFVCGLFGLLPGGDRDGPSDGEMPPVRSELPEARP